MQVIARASALLLALATASAIDGASSPCPPRAAQPAWLFSPGGITEFHSGRDARPYRKMSHPFYV